MGHLFWGRMSSGRIIRVYGAVEPNEAKATERAGPILEETDRSELQLVYAGRCWCPF